MVVPAADVRAVPAVEELLALGRGRGLAAVGVASARPFSSTRHDLEERKGQGLHGGMAFTYRNPARSTEPERALPDARALVVGAWSYLRPEPAGPSGSDPARRAGSDGGGVAGLAAEPSRGQPPGRRSRAARPPHGVVARYAREDHYGGLRAALEAIAERVRADGWRARVLADDNALVDRAAARRAGLGWYGKNANLLLPGQGSWFVLGSVLTDAPLPTTAPDDVVPDGCGTCTRCLDGCPTGAIVAPGVVDARRCLAWLLQASGPFSRDHRVALGDRIYGCDDCQEVCPPNRRTARRLDAEAAEVVGGAYVDVVEMLGLSDGELLERFGRWYIPRREARYLRRNALVVLGNVGDPADPVVIEALRRALGDPDPLVRGHAVWAARRMGRSDLIRPLADDPDPLVQDELAADVEVRSA